MSHKPITAADLHEVLENASAKVALWPEWKRRLSAAFVEGEDTDEHVDIPCAVRAIDAEIERLRARKRELLTKAACRKSGRFDRSGK